MSFGAFSLSSSAAASAEHPSRARNIERHALLPTVVAAAAVISSVLSAFTLGCPNLRKRGNLLRARNGNDRGAAIGSARAVGQKEGGLLLLRRCAAPESVQSGRCYSAFIHITFFRPNDQNSFVSLPPCLPEGGLRNEESITSLLPIT